MANPATKKEQYSIDLVLGKTTPGTYLYVCSENNRATAGVQNVYVKKTVFAGREPPQKITVKVEFDVPA